MNLVDELYSVARALEQAEVTYAVCGGVAVNIQLVVVSRDTLLKMKRLAGRPQDVADVKKLEHPDEE